MKKIFLCFFSAFLFTQMLYSQTPPVLPSQGSYYSDNYRNMFVEAGIDAAAVQNRLQTLWNQFFYGTANQKVYYEVGSDEAYVLDVANNDVRSEGMSYGMMICVQMNKQTEFNRLWKWVKNKMQYTSGQFEGYFCWQLDSNGNKIGGSPASDGEEYFIMALFFASHRWGDASGIFNYSQQANEILYHSMRRNDSGINGVTNLFNSANQQVVFVPHYGAATYTDPSYHLPAFYQLWSLWDTDSSRRTFWAQCAQKSRQMFPLFANSTTGLMPDYANFNGTPRDEGDHEHFLYDAWRCIMNVAMDYAWFKADDAEVALVNKIHNFFYSKGINSYGGNYQLNGTVFNNNTSHSPGLVACNATGALASNQAIAWNFVNAFHNTAIPSGTYRYYDGLLYFLNYLHLSGNFRIYKPQSPNNIQETKSNNDDFVFIENKIEFSKNQSIKIVSLSGQVMLSAQNIRKIDMSQFNAGVYILNIRDKAQETNYKINVY